MTNQSQVGVSERTGLLTNKISSRVATLKPSGIRKFFDIVATMDNVISLGIGEPDFVTPTSIMDAGIRSLKSGKTRYTSNSGIFELREAISEYLEQRYGIRYDPEKEIVITVGVSEALYMAMTALLNPGDEVLIPTPCFVAYQAEAILAGGEAIEIPCTFEDQFQPCASDIEAVLTPRSKVLLIGYPNNPTGAVAGRETLLEVAKLAEKHDLVVVSDELYDQLVYDTTHVCFAALPGMRERTILLGGFSKNYAMTGWRVGFAAAPQEALQAMLRVHQFTIMSAPTPAQHAAYEAMKNGADHVEQMRSEYNRRRRLIVDGLNHLGLTTFEPRGAFYAFPNITVSGMDEDTFSHRLLEEEHVAVVPGTAFGAGGEGFVRCSYATAYEKIEEALHRMEHFLQRHG